MQLAGALNDPAKRARVDNHEKRSENIGVINGRAEN